MQHAMLAHHTCVAGVALSCMGTCSMMIVFIDVWIVVEGGAVEMC